jgi:hypothetical protein
MSWKMVFVYSYGVFIDFAKTDTNSVWENIVDGDFESADT